MKPKDLPAPFCFNGRQLVISDGILHVPPHLPKYEWDGFPGWEKIFKNERSLHVEYCAGHGHWIIERARRAPEENWVAVEKRFDRVRRIWAKRENEGVKNLFIVCGEAHCVTRNYFEAGRAAALYINFPDPWPKKRHAKHRLIHADFLREVARVAAPGAPLVLATDDLETTARFIEELQSVPQLQPTLTAPHYAHEWPGYGDSVFDALWRREGKPIHYVEVQKR